MRASRARAAFSTSALPGWRPRQSCRAKRSLGECGARRYIETNDGDRAATRALIGIEERVSAHDFVPPAGSFIAGQDRRPNVHPRAVELDIRFCSRAQVVDPAGI